jgi:hypothetical protein
VSHPFDASVKHLITELLADWLPLSGRTADGPVEVIDADLATLTAAAVRVLRIRARPSDCCTWSRRRTANRSCRRG